MNRVIEMTPMGPARTRDTKLWNDFLNDMVKYNTFCPGIKRVIFNLKTTEMKPQVDGDGKPVVDEKGRVKRIATAVTPTLATIVYFTDGTKCSVVNSDTDVVKTETKTVEMPDGKTKSVIVATDAAKEAGIVYAIVKRIVGTVGRKDKQGRYNPDEIDGNGFGRKLRDMANAAYDTNYEAALKEAAQAKASADHQKREADAKARKARRRPTVEDNINKLVELNEKLLETLAAKA